MQQTARASGRRIALVPTMGALHEGHATLMRKAREQNAAVVVSIYVNPTQFGPNEDYTRYPRDLEADAALCKREGVDVVFAPEDPEIYPGQPSTWVEETAVAKPLEGERRPGHFRGVATVVAKLFNIVTPQVAVFGQKDFQQLKVVQRMVRDLNYPIQVVPVPTVREPDGLALSSRNRYLNGSERAQALVLYRALNVAQSKFRGGERNAHRIQSAMQLAVQLAPAARVDYIEVADAESLTPVTEAKAGDVVLLAVYIGKTRLIDNLILS